MQPYHGSADVGRFTTGIADYVTEPVPVIARNPCVYSPSLAGGILEPTGAGLSTAHKIVRACTDQYFTVGTPTNFQLYSNDTAMGYITDAVAGLRSKWKATNAKVIVVGTSHGSNAAIRWAMDNPTLVACLLLFLPVVDLQDVYVNNISGNRAACATAWGLNSADSASRIPTRGDTYARRAELASIPQLAYYANDDPYAAHLLDGTWASATGATLVDCGAVGHTDTVLSTAPVTNYVSFIQGHA